MDGILEEVKEGEFEILSLFCNNLITFWIILHLYSVLVLIILQPANLVHGDDPDWAHSHRSKRRWVEVGGHANPASSTERGAAAVGRLL